MEKYDIIVNPLTKRKVKINTPLGKSILGQYISILRGGSIEFEEMGTIYLYEALEKHWGEIIRMHHRIIDGEQVDMYEYEATELGYNEGLKEAIYTIIANDDSRIYTQKDSLVINDDGSSAILTIERQVELWYKNNSQVVYDSNKSIEDRIYDLYILMQSCSENEKLKKLFTYPDHQVIAKMIQTEFDNYDEETDETEFGIWYNARDIFVRPYIETLESNIFPVIKSAIPSINRA